MEDSKTRAKFPGPSPLVRQREEYARLVARGVSNAEACRVVGVNRRTGTRWRYGRSVPARDGTQRQYPAMIEATKDESQRSAVPVRGGAGPDRGQAPGQAQHADDRPRTGAECLDGQP